MQTSTCINMEINDYFETLPSMDPKALNLVDINNDCKELIFEYLESEDLVNIAETNKQLNTAVCAVFKRQYGKKLIAFEEWGRTMDSWISCFPATCTECPYDGIKVLSIRTAVMTLKVLRNFGHTIKNIVIHYLGFTQHMNVIDHVEMYVAEYCSESLETLQAVGKFVAYRYGRNKKEKQFFENIEKLFPKVRAIEIDGCSLGRKLFNKLFPNLESLDLQSIFYKDFALIKEHFPKLKKLSFHQALSGDLSVEEIHVIEMIKLNPQLEQLKLEGRKVYTHRLIECISENLPLLEYFHIADSQSINAPSMHPSFHFNNVVDFRLDERWWRFPNLSIDLFTFSKLKHISIAGNVNLDDINTCQPILNFIHKNKTLKSIEMYGIFGNLDMLFDFEFILSNIEELRILYYYNKNPLTDTFYVYSIFRFLKRSRSLKKFLIKVTRYHYDAFENFCKEIDTEFKISTNQIQKCEKCTSKRTHEMYQSVEYIINETEDFSSKTYICSIGREYDELIPREFSFVECSRLN